MHDCMVSYTLAASIQVRIALVPLGAVAAVPGTTGGLDAYAVLVDACI